MADTDLTKAMAGMKIVDQSEKENNGDGGLKQPVNGEDRVAFSQKDSRKSHLESSHSIVISSLTMLQEDPPPRTFHSRPPNPRARPLPPVTTANWRAK